jgi:acyl-CoA synthetase (AMP-forming)/AMP-acid ligase II
MDRDMNIGARLGELARSHGDRAAIVDARGTSSFRQFHARVARFGNALHGLGLRKGDRVAFLISDIREYLEADYGTMAAGLVRVPMDPRLLRHELIELLRFAGARALVTHAAFAEKVDGIVNDVDGLQWVIGVGSGVCGGTGLRYEALLEKASDDPLSPPNGEDLATLNFSGGTTGAPKAVMLRHRDLAAVARHMIAGFDIASDAVFLNVRPLWPIAQVIAMSHLLAGATVVLGGRADPETLAARVQQSGATRMSLVPTQLVRWLDHLRAGDPRLDRLQAIYVGGSRLPPAVFERALAAIGPKIGVLYGLTEAPVTCYMPPETLDVPAPRRARLLESVGRPLSGYQVRLESDMRGDNRERIENRVPIATQGRGPAAIATASGEILIRGNHVMSGYWRREDLTRTALRGGWFHTGDIGEIDEADNLYVVGRLSDVIRSGSSSIMPKEVEDAIVSHPAVDDVAVIGLPDPEWGEAVTAFVVLKPGMSVNADDLMEHCRAHLAPFKKPRSVRLVASLPRSHYGKIMRAQLLAQAAT